ncbi:MAG TPA: hypothetical protein VK255_01975, partial [Patescibacteria group bacterium]|nr:hypothetical protein [Patescibacteria group bacterium]
MSQEKHYVSPAVKKIIEGFGKKFNKTPAELLAMEASADQKIRLLAPIPALGRYRKDVIFLQELTSLWAWGKLRFQVLIEYYIALSEKLETYDGRFADKKIIGNLSDEDKKSLRRIGLTMDEIVQAEYLEKFTDQDTAAAATLLKIIIAIDIPHLEKWIEGIHFACTSEDVIGIVTGRIGTELVFGNVITAILDFCQFLINFALKHDKSGFFEIPNMLPLPAYSHKQSAEIT